MYQNVPRLKQYTWKEILVKNFELQKLEPLVVQKILSGQPYEASKGGQNGRNAECGKQLEETGACILDLDLLWCRRMAWTWSEETTHLEVRPAVRGEGPVVKVDGNAAKSDRDWIYWRLPSVATREVFSADRREAKVRMDRGEVRIGVITADVKLGDNWCDRDQIGRAIFLDTFFGVLRTGDREATSGTKLKAAVGDVVTVRLHEGFVLFLINGFEVGQVPADTRQELRVAVQASISEMNPRYYRHKVRARIAPGAKNTCFLRRCLCELETDGRAHGSFGTRETQFR